LELNHSSAGAWSNPSVVTKNEPEISGPRPDIPSQNFIGGGKFYLMNGLEANQGNYSLADGSIKQATDTDLKEAIQAHLDSDGGVLTEKNAAVLRPNQTYRPK
jgi:hypothetical protein